MRSGGARLYYGWPLVGALGLTTIVSYGTTQYLFGVLLVPIQRETGWSRGALSGAYSDMMVGGLGPDTFTPLHSGLYPDGVVYYFLDSGHTTGVTVNLTKSYDYGIYQVKTEPPHRHGADPVIVLFKDKYWLFSTWDRPGYRVSDDLVHWK